MSLQPRLCATKSLLIVLTHALATESVRFCGFSESEATHITRALNIVVSFYFGLKLAHVSYRNRRHHKL